MCCYIVNTVGSHSLDMDKCFRSNFASEKSTFPAKIQFLFFSWRVFVVGEALAGNADDVKIHTFIRHSYVVRRNLGGKFHFTSHFRATSEGTIVLLFCARLSCVACRKTEAPLMRYGFVLLWFFPCDTNPRLVVLFLLIQLARKEWSIDLRISIWLILLRENTRTPQRLFDLGYQEKVLGSLGKKKWDSQKGTQFPK